MLTRQALETELARIDARMPLLMRRPAQLGWELADLHEMLTAQAHPFDRRFVEAELSRICRGHGVESPCGGPVAGHRRAAA